MAERKDDGGPAFPRTPSSPLGYDGQTGITVRDLLAGLALIGYITRGSPEEPDRRAIYAYAQADLMLEERKR